MHLKLNDEIAHAAHPLRMLARFNLLPGKKDSALGQLKEAMRMLQQQPQPTPYLYPGFFLKLKEIIPDITIAEQRMAALTRLHLNTKQRASMPGISPDSDYKIRQRLRKRLQLDDEVTTETYLTKI